MTEEFGKYRLIKKIAQGGMAEVFLATQSAALPGFEKQIAIKRIFPNLATDENMRTMFIDEATIAARLNHPNIVQIYDVGEVDQYLFLAMEYVDGYDFRNVLVKAQQKGVSIPYPLAVNIIMNAAAGLHHAHTLVAPDGTPIKVIHRDMSPQNILISKGGNVKVCDFGVAKANVRTGMTRAGELKGKISYMSPEQIEGNVEIDPRSDIFSLGIVLYEATTMTRLFRQGTDYEKMRNILDGNIRPPSEVTPGYPEDLEIIVLKCLANNRDDRFQTAKDLQVALDGWLSRTGVSQSALELERFLAFLFEDTPINPSTEPIKLPADLASKVNNVRRIAKSSSLHLEDLSARSISIPRPDKDDPLVFAAKDNNSFSNKTAERRKVLITSSDIFDRNSRGFVPPDPSYYDGDEEDEFDAPDGVEQEIKTSEYQVHDRGISLPGPIPTSGFSAPASNPNLPATTSSSILRSAPPKKRGATNGYEGSSPKVDLSSPVSVQNPIPTGNIQESRPSEPWVDEPPKNDSNWIAIFIILIILGGLGGGYYYIFILNAPKPDTAPSVAETPEKTKLADKFTLTDLRTNVPNVHWIVNGQLPAFSDASGVSILKGKDNRVTAYKEKFLPASDQLSDSNVFDHPPLELKPDDSKMDAKFEITSQPPGATLFVDGVPVGKTPFNGTNLSKLFPHHVYVSADGYASYIGYIFTPNPENSLKVTLTKGEVTKTNVIIKVTPDKSIVQLNGTDIESPTTQSVEPGTIVDFAQVGPDFYPFDYIIDTTGIGTVEFQLPVIPDKRPKGTLSLSVKPDVRVFIDGSIVPSGTVNKKAVPAGKLPITLESSLGRASTELEIGKDSDNAYQLDFDGKKIEVKKLPPIIVKKPK